MSTTEAFDLSGFAGLSLVPRGFSRNFALQVESYDLTGETHFVVGTDLSSGTENRRVRVFLRELRDGAAGANRPPIHCYAGSDDPRSERCLTPPGAVIMVQGAFDDAEVGAVSPYWLNRIVNDGQDLADRYTAVLPLAHARLSRPIFKGKGPSSKTFCVCDILHPGKITHAAQVGELDDQLFECLATAATDLPGKNVAVIRLISAYNGQSSTQALDRRSIASGDGNYVLEHPSDAISRLWGAMAPDYAASLKAAINNGQVGAHVMPATRYRLVGKSLELLANDQNRRPHLAYERFALAANLNESGFLSATVALQRQRPSVQQPAGGDDFYVTGIWPEFSDSLPQSLQQFPF